MLIILGIIKSIVSHQSVLAAVGAPPPIRPGYKFVHVAWYKYDAETEIFQAIFEGILALILGNGFAIWIMIKNQNNNYFWVGLTQMIVSWFFSFTQTIKASYGYLNLEYTFDGIVLTDYVEMEFYSIMDLPSANLSLIGYLVYLDQLFFGNKRLPFYANILMSIALCLFPKTWIAATYFIIQLPLDFIMLTIFYPFFPEFDVPFIRWD